MPTHRPRARRVALVALAAALLASASGAALAASSATPYFAPGSEVASPAGAEQAAGEQLAQLVGVSCTGPGDCVAVGDYADGWDAVADAAELVPMAVTETDGSWGTPVEIEPPANEYSATYPSAELAGVDCPSAGECVAVGWYWTDDPQPREEAMVATEIGGFWTQAQEITALPANADTTDQSESTDQHAWLEGVSCPSSIDDCEAVGGYSDDTGGSSPTPDEEAMTLAEVGGVWQTAVELTLPSGQTGVAGAQDAGLQDISCTGSGDCEAGGYYADANSAYTDGVDDDYQAMVASQTGGGAWQPATELALPAGATSATDAQDAYVFSIACPASGDCTAVGGYVDTAGSGQAMATGESGGSWSAAQRIALPSNARSPTSDADDVGLWGVWCASPGNCDAAGGYEDTTASAQAMDVTELGGSWGTAVATALPAGADATPGDGYGAYWDRLACSSLTDCVEVGSYRDGGGSFQAMVSSSVPALALATASLPPASAGSPYSAQLSATGGSGDYAWSIATGTLPAGLTLNATTGAISGTPTAPGTSTVTFAATDAGPPSQTATAQLGLSVAGPTITSLRAHRRHVTVAVACGATPPAVCAGDLTLTTVEHLRHGRASGFSARARTRTITLA
ncbi:MAG TPA: Ig domain-containing protein, partial [Solirubrobacteraceae bacterium]|nr:Ig domain-containing protein [Solirubrobacteraceae bacterium]